MPIWSRPVVLNTSCINFLTKHLPYWFSSCLKTPIKFKCQVTLAWRTLIEGPVFNVFQIFFTSRTVYFPLNLYSKYFFISVHYYYYDDSLIPHRIQDLTQTDKRNLFDDAGSIKNNITEAVHSAFSY